MNDRTSQIPELVAQVAVAYFSNSPVAVADIPLVMRGIAEGLTCVEARDPVPDGELGAESKQAEAVTAQARKTTEPEIGQSVPVARAYKATEAEIRESISPDGLTSFENGKKYRMLKRHLSVRGLTPALYRERWGLPNDYPMTAASYSAERSAVAKRIGLGGRTTQVRGGRRRK